MLIRRSLKILHSLGSCGMIGAFVGILVLLAFGAQNTPQSFADMRQSLALLANWVLLPSLAIVLVSGLLAMAAHTPFLSKGWALLKAAFGIIMFKGTLHISGAIGEYADKISAHVAANSTFPPETIQSDFYSETTMLWILLLLSVANVIVGVWRPKFSKKETVRRTSNEAVPAWTQRVKKPTPPRQSSPVTDRAA